MKKIGSFTKEGRELIGTIAVLQFETNARIIPVFAKSSMTSPDYVMIKVSDKGGFDVELGMLWKKDSLRQRVSYFDVTLDDPALSQPINAVLWENTDDKIWYLFWDRNASAEQMIEKLYVQEELKPLLGIRPLSRVTQHMRLHYPDLVTG